MLEQRSGKWTCYRLTEDADFGIDQVKDIPNEYQLEGWSIVLRRLCIIERRKQNFTATGAINRGLDRNMINVQRN